MHRFVSRIAQSRTKPFLFGIGLCLLILAATPWRRSNTNRSWISSVRFSRDGQSLFAGLADGRILQWNLRSRTVERVFPSFGTVPAFSKPSDAAVWTSDSSGVVRRLSPGSNAEFRVLGDGFQRTALSSNAQLIAASNRINRLEIRNIRSAENLHRLDGHQNLVTHLQWGNQDRNLASASRDHTVIVWNLDEGAPRFQLKLKDRPTALAWSPDDSRLATCGGRTVQIWSCSGGQLLRAITLTMTWARALMWSEDGRHLIVAGQGIAIYDVETGALLRNNPAPTCSRADYCPGTELIAVADNDALELVSAKTLQPVATLSISNWWPPWQLPALGALVCALPLIAQAVRRRSSFTLITQPKTVLARRTLLLVGALMLLVGAGSASLLKSSGVTGWTAWEEAVAHVIAMIVTLSITGTMVLWTGLESDTGWPVAAGFWSFLLLPCLVIVWCLCGPPLATWFGWTTVRAVEFWEWTIPPVVVGGTLAFVVGMAAGQLVRLAAGRAWMWFSGLALTIGLAAGSDGLSSTFASLLVASSRGPDKILGVYWSNNVVFGAVTGSVLGVSVASILTGLFVWKLQQRRPTAPTTPGFESGHAPTISEPR